MNKTLTIELEMPTQERKMVQMYQIGDGHACGKDAITHMRIGKIALRAGDAGHADLRFWTTEVQDFGPATIRVVDGVVTITPDDPNYGLAKIPTTLGEVRRLGAGHYFLVFESDRPCMMTDTADACRMCHVNQGGQLVRGSDDGTPITYLGRAKGAVVK